MDFRVLGPLELADGAVSVAVTSPKQRLLLAALVVQANQVVGTDRLAELIWRDDERPARAGGVVQTYVSRLRSALGGADVLGTSGVGYILRLAPDQLDAARFEHLLDEAKQELRDRPASALDMLDGALGLWRGPAYGELSHEDFVQPEAVRLEELRLVALEERAEARLALGDHEALVGELEAMVVEHPLRERLRAKLMVALYRSGRHPDALRTYQDHRRVLGDEMGLEPSPPLRDLEARILRHDPSLAAPPPPARSKPFAPVPAPRRVTSFVGREGVVSALIDELRRERLVTLTGTGGVGKTRLATEVAAEAGRSFPDGVAICPLAPVADPAAVVSVLATALGVQQRRERTIEESLIDFLRPRRMVLVLDNCEHVLDTAAGLVGRLLIDAGHLAVLATSRERLAVPGERVWPVPPLPVPLADDDPGVASVALFAERARAVRPEFNASGSNLAAMAEICRRLDGVPLAIELAAARVASMNVADVAERLQSRFQLLSGGTRSSEARHRSLGAVVDWSYDLLDEGERRLFDRLSVFAGSFTLAAVEDVCAGDGVERTSVVDLLGSLVDKSMVTIGNADDLARYALLETLRHYGREHLEATGDQQVWLERHTRHFTALAEEAADRLCGADDVRWMRRIGEELDNLREVHHRAVSSGDVDRALRLSAALVTYAMHVWTPELFSWAGAAARLGEGSGHALVPLVLGAAAIGAWRRDLDEAASLARQSLAATEPDDPAARLAYYALGIVAMSEGRMDDAVEQLRRSAALAEQAGDHFRAVLSLVIEALALTYGGKVDSGIERAEAALTLARSGGGRSLVAWALYAKGEALREDQPGQALPLFDQSRALAAEVNPFVAGVAGVSAATVRARLDDPADSLGDFQALLEYWRRVGVWTTQWTTLRNLIDVFVRLGADEPAGVLHGAVAASSTAAPVFGADAERLAGAMGVLELRVGRGCLAAWTEQGERLTDDEAVDYACAQIERLRPARTGPP